MLRKIFVVLSFLGFMAALSFVKPVTAVEKYTIKEMTPAVKSALENRRDRYDNLTALKGEGKIGESNRGYVEALSAEENIADIVDAENADRKIIYETIAEQNNLEGALETIEKVFAQTQRENAQPGEKIELEDGRWVKKIIE